MTTELFTMQYTNFNDYVGAMSVDSPYALMLDWWCRLEREIRSCCKQRGFKSDVSSARLIESLAESGIISSSTAKQIHNLRRRRNKIAHDLYIPTITAADAESFARESWKLSWELHRAVDVT